MISFFVSYLPYKLLYTLFVQYNNDLAYEYLINNSLNEDDIIIRDESLTHEYKSYFQTPFEGIPIPEVIKGQTIYKLGKENFTHTNQIKKYLQTQCLKTIVGFLNTEGGNLIIGVRETKGRKNKF